MFEKQFGFETRLAEVVKKSAYISSSRAKWQSVKPMRVLMQDNFSFNDNWFYYVRQAYDNLKYKALLKRPQLCFPMNLGNLIIPSIEIFLFGMSLHKRDAAFFSLILFPGIFPNDIDKCFPAKKITDLTRKPFDHRHMNADWLCK